MAIRILALCCLACALVAQERKPKESELSAAEQAAKVLDTVEVDGLVYPTVDERRDVYYSLEAVLKAEKEREALEAAEQDPGVAGSSATQVVQMGEADDVKQAELYAKQAVGEVESFIRSENWERAMSTAERHMNRLRPMLEGFSDSAALAQAQTMLQQYYVLAENKKLYEEARAQFEALGLRVEGIMWSADQPSLAIISDEPVARGVNDRVKGTVIKNIDQNRVDFMYSYRQRRFHFQLYLEPNN